MRKFKLIPVVFVLLLGLQTANADWVRRDTKSFAWYRDIVFVTATNGWITGTDGVLLSTTDSGATWTSHKKFTNDALIQIHFINETTGWILCERNLYSRGNSATSYLRKTIDGGRTWEKIEFADGGRERMTKLVFNNDGIGTAFGEGGVFYTLQEDGREWKRSQTAIHYLLLDGAYSQGRIGAIAGSGGTIMFTEDGGFTWEKASLLGDTDTRFNAIFFSEGKGAWAVGSRGRIFHSNGGARLWRQQDSTVTANLNDVYFTSEKGGWAVGEQGIIVRTRDGGKTWTDVDSRVTHRLEKITFNGSTGWAIGFGGTLLTYTDAERTGSETGAPQLLKRN